MRESLPREPRRVVQQTSELRRMRAHRNGKQPCAIVCPLDVTPQECGKERARAHDKGATRRVVALMCARRQAGLPRPVSVHEAYADLRAMSEVLDTYLRLAADTDQVHPNASQRRAVRMAFSCSVTACASGNVDVALAQLTVVSEQVSRWMYHQTAPVMAWTPLVADVNLVAATLAHAHDGDAHRACTYVAEAADAWARALRALDPRTTAPQLRAMVMRRARTLAACADSLHSDVRALRVVHDVDT